MSRPPISRLPTPPSQRHKSHTSGLSSASPNRPSTPNGVLANIDLNSGTVTAGGSERVKVVVRLRPPLRAEEEGGAVTVDGDGRKLQLHRPGAQTPQTDHVYDVVLPPQSTQQDVYVAAVKDVVEDVMNGYNGTVMAYGQTGAGKTHTLGNIEPKAIGMIPRAVAEIFKQADEDRMHVYTVGMSYIQIYMELIQDLLKPDSDNLQIREDASGVFVSGVHEVKVTSMEQCLHYLELGEQNRIFAFTHLNAHSSRSHAVVMLTVTKRARHLSPKESAEMKALEKDGVTPQKVKVAKLFLVDLAGSERLKKSKSVGIRQNEAISINLSLTTLGMCINARATDSPHVPFRDSKLTRLLQESLGGNAKTSLIICVADVKMHVDESLMSLQFASRAMCVKNKPTINERIDYKALQDELLAEINSGDRTEKRREITAELFRQDYEILQKERDQFRQVAEALKRENEEEEERRLRMLEKKEQELRAHQQELQRQQAQLEEHRQQQNILSKTLQEVQRERDQYLKRTESLHKEKEEERRRLLDAKEQELSSHQREAHNWRQQVEAARKIHADFEDKIRTLEIERDACKQQAETFKINMLSTLEVSEQLQQQIKEAQAQLSEDRAHSASLLAAAEQQYAAKLEALVNDRAEETAELVLKHEAQLNAMQDKHFEEMEKLQGCLAKAAAEHAAEARAASVAHAEEVTALKLNLEDIIGGLRRELAAAQEARANDLARAQELHKGEVDGLHVTFANQLEEARVRFASAEEEHALLVRQLQDDRDSTHRDLTDRHHAELQKLLAEHQQQAAELQHRISELENAGHLLQEEKATLSGKLRSLKAEKEAQDQQVRMQQEQLAAAHRQTTELQTAVLNMQAQAAGMISSMERRFDEALSQKSKALDHLQRQVSKVRGPLANLQHQRLQLLSMRAQLSEHAAELTSQVSSLEGALEGRTREAALLTNDLNDSRREAEQLRRELDDMGLEVDSKEEDNDNLREQLQAMQAHASCLQKQLEGSRKQCNGLELQLEKFTADRANALQHRTALRRHHCAAAVIQRAWRMHSKRRLVSNLNQGEQELDRAIQKVSKLEQHSRHLAASQKQTNVTLGMNLVQHSMSSFRDGVESIMASFLLPKKELQARLNAQQRIQNLSPMGSNSFNAASPMRGMLTPRRSNSITTPRTPPSQRLPLSPLSSHLSKFSSPASARRLSNGSQY